MLLSDTLVSPVLSYGSEVWAPQIMLEKTNPCDNVQLGFLRRLVGVRQSTSSLLVYAETGQLPLLCSGVSGWLGFGTVYCRLHQAA
jgi:hypothetical protein